MKQIEIDRFRNLPWNWRNINTFRTAPFCLLQAFTIVFCVASASAQNSLTWDPNGNGGTTSASGNWDVSTANWWNGTADQVWSQISSTVSTTNAVFGGGDGTYTVNIDASSVAVSNIFFNNSGYTISGAGIYIPNKGGFVVAAGKTATVTAPIVSGNDNNSVDVGGGAVLNLQGNMNSNGGSSPFLTAVGTGTVNLGGGSSSAIFAPNNTDLIDCNVNFDSGTWTQGSGGNFYIGYNGGSFNGVSDNTGAFTINGGTLNVTGDKIIVCRSGGTGTLTLNSGAINFWTGASGSVSANAVVAIPNNDNGANKANVYVNGGTFTIGNSGYAAQIQLMAGGSSSTEYGILSQSAGTILAYGGIVFGENGGTYSGGTASVTNSGGSLYLGANGFLFDSGHPATSSITLSGGTVGALANWSSVMPMTLATLNGNITFRCADNNNNPFNISLSGALTGPGGLNVDGGGTLTLSGTNLFAGSTAVSNGMLALVTSPLGATDGSSMTLDGSAGSPTLSVASSPGQSISTGPLTFQNGSTTLGFSFGSLQPSASVAPIQISGNVNFAATPTVNVVGSGIPVGTYPLITCTGTISGTPPTAVTITGQTATGHITQTGNTISLVITSSSVVNPPESWRVGNGVWDINTTPNWTKNGSQATYTDGSPVLFDDTASGPFPITITNNTVVSPTSVTANNTSGDNYTIAGTGRIAGSTGVSVLGGGTLTLTEANTYNGGTTLSSGQLNINYGGDSSGQDSAIGTGTLTINGGAIDNTSGSNIVLVPTIAENWSNNWTFVGSSSLDLGQGQVSLDAQMVGVTVNTNTLEVDGVITDNGNEFGMTVQGGGTLTLMGANNFFGNFELVSGGLNIGNALALGYGTCIIDGGSIDNYSGGPLTLNSGASGSPGAYTWAGNFSYLGMSNSLNLGPGTVTVTLPTSMTLNVVSNTLVTQGQIFGGNTLVHKTGMGTWDITGYGANDLGMSIDQGTVLFDKNTGFLINNLGLIIQSNAVAFETGIGGPTQPQIQTTQPVTLNSGGTWDLNGNSEGVASFTNNNGILRNSSTTGISGLTNNATVSTLSGANCAFDVTNSGAVLNVWTILGGSGSLVKTGNGLVDLEYTNTYTGNTTVSGGTLEINAACLTNTSAVSINTNALLDLNFSATNQIAALNLGGTNQLPGLYNATTTPYITGTGSLLVVPVAPANPLTNLAFTTRPVITKTTLTISATNAGAGTIYLLTSTNLTAPISTWTPIWTNVLGGSGGFTTNLLNAINPAVSQQFYLLSSTNN